jgi:outer membrane biosynthesis protein TonB
MFRKTLQVFKIPFSTRFWLICRSTIALLLCAAANQILAAETSAAPDVRLVIDISGSMKKNDPQNLRVPAVRLLTNLMPTGSRAGIWTFGQYVNNLLPVKTVDAAWAAQATAAAGQINSLGAFTNIPDALTKAMDGWQGDASSPRHLILLTDGVVDVAKDATENIKARQRLLTEILPQLKNAGVHVHTIALSREADAELLSKLSRETEALFEMVESPEALNKVFLRIFEQSAPRDTVPLKDNKFVVDNAIEEFTVLVFKSGDRAVSLITPDNKSINKTQTPEGWRWYSDARYELVTVTKPQAGEWGLDAVVDPDNRVMVVSKLSLKIDELPRVVMPGEPLRFIATLLDDNKPVNKTEFLSLVSASATIQSELTSQVELKNQSNGRFEGAWQAPESSAAATITITVQAPTFVRSRQFTVQIAQGSLTLTALEQAEHQSRFEVAWSADIFDSSGLQLNGQLVHDGQSSPIELQQENGKTVIAINHNEPGTYQLIIEAKGKSASGRDVVLQAKSPEWKVSAPEPEAAPHDEHHPSPEPKKHDEHSDAKEHHEEPVEKPAETPATTPEESDSTFFWIIVGVVNGLLVIIGGGVWWVIKRKQKSATTDIEKALGE